jgi:phosphosulfolactate synthase
VRTNHLNGWEMDFNFPIEGRTPKPRDEGLTMVLDKGLGLQETTDLLEVGASYLDFLKLSFGTSALYTPELLHKKISLARSYGVDVLPGGTFFEVAYIQGKAELYLERAKALGFSAIEISDGTIELPAAARTKYIKHAVGLGFKVLTEVGKKDQRDSSPISLMREQIQQDVKDGAYKVIIEARESGIGVSIFDDQGNIDFFKMQQLLLAVADEAAIMWEAPLKKQQLAFIKMLGNNVNLGNIAPKDILALECLRVGLRGDTLRIALREQLPANQGKEKGVTSF